MLKSTSAFGGGGGGSSLPSGGGRGRGEGKGAPKKALKADITVGLYSLMLFYTFVGNIFSVGQAFFPSVASFSVGNYMCIWLLGFLCLGVCEFDLI